MNYYQINYTRLALLLLPHVLRKPLLLAFCRALTCSVSALHGTFVRQRLVDLRRIRMNGQVCYLRGGLNDELDPTERRIRIVDRRSEGQWVMARDESEPYQLLLPEAGIMLYDETGIFEEAAFFAIRVPWGAEETDLTNRLRSFVATYKLAGRKYVIQYS